MQVGYAKNHDFRRIAGYRSMTDGVHANNNSGHQAVYRTHRHASVNLCLSQPAWTITTKRREQNLFIRSGKSEAEVTNNKRLRSTYYTIEATDKQSIAQPLCDSRVTCLTHMPKKWFS